MSVVAAGQGAARPAAGPAVCSDPQDLYEPAGRKCIATVLEPWLTRQSATPYELLHRPDLAAKLENAGADLQQALQRIAVPAALGGAGSVHEVIRRLHTVCDKAFARLQRLRGASAPAPATPQSFPALLAALPDGPDGRFALGCAVAAAMAEASTWTLKLEALLDLADSGAAGGDAALEPALGDLLRFPAAERELLGADGDLGGRILARLRLTHAPTFAAVARVHPALAVEASAPTAARLAQAFGAGRFPDARRALAKQALAAFAGGGRLRPAQPVGEIESLRLLAVVLTASADEILPADDVREAVVARSRLLVEPAFVSALLDAASDPFAEVAALLQVLENVAGDANRRRALRHIEAALAARRLEQVIATTRAPEACAPALAAFRHRVVRAGAGMVGVDDLLTQFDTLDVKLREAAQRAALRRNP